MAGWMAGAEGGGDGCLVAARSTLINPVKLSTASSALSPRWWTMPLSSPFARACSINKPNLGVGGIFFCPQAVQRFQQFSSAFPKTNEELVYLVEENGDDDQRKMTEKWQ